MAAAPPGSNAIRSAKDLFSALLSVAPVPSYNDDVKAKAASLLQDLVVLSNQSAIPAASVLLCRRYANVPRNSNAFPPLFVLDENSKMAPL